MNSRLWLTRAATLLAGWLVVWIGLLLVDYTIRGAVLGGVLLAAATLWWFAQDNGGRVGPIAWAGNRPSDAQRALNTGSRIEHRISVGAEPLLMADEAHRTLRTIAVQRLRMVHGVDFDAEPEAARALLGPTVHDYLTGPVQPAVRGFARRMSAIVDRIEEL